MSWYDRPVASFVGSTGAPVWIGGNSVPALTRLRFSAAGDRLFVKYGQGGTAILDAYTGNPIPGSFSGASGYDTAFDVSVDGLRGVGGASPLQVRSFNNGAVLSTVAGHPNAFIYGLSFVPGERYLASGGSDDTLRLWDLVAGTEVFRYDQETGGQTGGGSGPYDLAVSPNGLLLAYGLADARIVVAENPVRNPVPTLATAMPSAIVVGSPATMVTIGGSGFIPGTVASVGGSSRTTTVVSATVLMVALTTADLSRAGSLTLTASNPSPGGGASQGLLLNVGAAVRIVPSVTLARNGGSVVATVSVANVGVGKALGVSVSAAALGSSQTSSTLPIQVGDLAAGASKSLPLTFSVDAAGTVTTLRISGAYVGGTFSATLRVTLP